MLSSAFPALRSAAPGEIQEERLPDLKHLIVFDDTAVSVSGSNGSSKVNGVEDWRETRATVDFREVLLWDENGQESRIVQSMGDMLQKDDIVNLQFTR